MGRVRRAVYGLVATLLVTTIILQIRPDIAFAYGQILDRSITLSSSQAAATGVSYLVTFTPATTGAVGSIAIDFCGNTPILGDQCYNNNTTTPAAPTPGTHTPSFPSPAATVTGGAGIGNLTTGTWGAATVNSGRTFTLTNTGSAMTFNAGTPYYFTITGVTNPSDVDDNNAGNQVGTYYGRILTFPNASTSNYADGYTATNLATNIPTDAGGVAISTASQITITAKVQERIVFCVYTTGAGNNCTGKSGNDVILGDTNGVLDTVGPFVDKSAKFTVSTNASQGVKIRVRGTTLTSGSNTITANATPDTSTAGNEEFGMCLYESASVAGGLSAEADYDGGAGGLCAGTTQTAGTATAGGDNGAEFTFDDNATNGTNSTYGEHIATKLAGDFSTGTLVFIGNVSNSTEAGIYKTTLTFIATGTY